MNAPVHLVTHLLNCVPSFWLTHTRYLHEHMVLFCDINPRLYGSLPLREDKLFLRGVRTPCSYLQYPLSSALPSHSLSSLGEVSRCSDPTGVLICFLFSNLEHHVLIWYLVSINCQFSRMYNYMGGGLLSMLERHCLDYS